MSGYIAHRAHTDKLLLTALWDSSRCVGRDKWLYNRGMIVEECL